MFKKNWVKFIILVFLFTVVTSPFVVLFGPFNNVKRAVIGAILQSRHPHYITWLFDEDELQSILGTVGVVKSQDLFKFNAREDKSLNLEKIQSARYVGYILEIPDPRRIQVGTAANIQEKGDTTSNIAKMNNAVAAINGGGFHDPNGTGTGRLPYGFILHDGDYVKTQLGDMKAMEGITFGPPLIVDGKKMITEGDGGWGVGPRTAIGQKKDGTVLFLVIDGRQPGYSLGATLRDVQDILYEKGCYIAANLDGGSSSTLYLNGKVVNKPADLLGERMIPTAFIVK